MTTPNEYLHSQDNTNKRSAGELPQNENEAERNEFNKYKSNQEIESLKTQNEQLKQKIEHQKKDFDYKFGVRRSAIVSVYCFIAVLVFFLVIILWQIIFCGDSLSSIICLLIGIIISAIVILMSSIIKAVSTKQSDEMPLPVLMQTLRELFKNSQ